MASTKFNQGRFSPINPTKYKGNPGNIQYRSGWELSFMSMLDKNPNVLEWSSEEQAIAYKSPKDNRVHRYFVDFILKMKHPNGKIESMMVEIKPYNQVVAPKRTPKKNDKAFLKEVVTWGINQAKWKAALMYAKAKGHNFYVITKDKQDKFVTLNESQFIMDV